MKSLNMLDLAGEQAIVGDAVRQAVERVFAHQRYINGPEIGELETAIAALCDRKHAVALSSGTDALLCAMMALDIGPGDEVIVPTFTFFATAGCVHRLGATPVPVDIDEATFNIDPARVADAITPRTRLIIPVHLFGQCADMEAVEDIARKHDRITVLADAAQAIGSSRDGKSSCSYGFAATLSFYPTKNLGAFGDAGGLITDDDTFAERCRLLRNHGQSSQYYHDSVGGNFRLDTIQAAVLLAKLGYFDDFQRRRQTNAARYDQLLADAPVQTPAIQSGNVSAYHQYSIVGPDRDALVAHLREQGIGSAVYYPVPIHLQPCFAGLGMQRGDLPVAERLSERILSLPVHPMLEDADVQRIAEAVKTFYGSDGGVCMSSHQERTRSAS